MMLNFRTLALASLVFCSGMANTAEANECDDVLEIKSKAMKEVHRIRDNTRAKMDSLGQSQNELDEWGRLFCEELAEADVEYQRQNVKFHSLIVTACKYSKKAGDKLLLDWQRFVSRAED